MSDELLKKNIMQADGVKNQLGPDGKHLYRNTTQNAAAKVVDLQKVSRKDNGQISGVPTQSNTTKAQSNLMQQTVNLNLFKNESDAK